MWRHASTNDGIDISFPHQENCVFCRTEMRIVAIENRWPLDEKTLAKEHEMSMAAAAKYADDIYLTHRPITSDFYLEDVTFHCCPVCGWWCILQQFQYDTARMPYMAFQWAAGALMSNEFPETSAPISEVRSYLCARYDKRFLINPYQLEDVVASIFRSFKCEVHVSNRSHDNGLDMFGFDPHGRPFGVQVKRYRKKIGIEQLREFVGALTLHGNLRGIFVTTSSFTNGAPKLCGQAKIAGIPLKCCDAQKLFEMLKVAQVREFDSTGLEELAATYSKNVSVLNYGAPLHMNTL